MRKKTEAEDNSHNPPDVSTAPDDELLTVPEAAAFLHIAVGTAFHWISEGRLPTIHLSARCVRFSKVALQKWLKERSRRAREPIV